MNRYEVSIVANNKQEVLNTVIFLHSIGEETCSNLNSYVSTHFILNRKYKFTFNNVKKKWWMSSTNHTEFISDSISLQEFSKLYEEAGFVKHPLEDTSGETKWAVQFKNADEHFRLQNYIKVHYYELGIYDKIASNYGNTDLWGSPPYKNSFSFDKHNYWSIQGYKLYTFEKFSEIIPNSAIERPLFSHDYKRRFWNGERCYRASKERPDYYEVHIVTESDKGDLYGNYKYYTEGEFIELMI